MYWVIEGDFMFQQNFEFQTKIYNYKYKTQ